MNNVKTAYYFKITIMDRTTYGTGRVMIIPAHGWLSEEDNGWELALYCEKGASCFIRMK